MTMIKNDKNIKPYFSTKGIIIKDGKFLALHKAIDTEHKFEFPGGRMEYGECAEETIVREIFEETGLNINPVKLLDTWNLVKDDFHATGVFFLCEVIDGEFKLSDEHDELKWLDLSNKELDILHDNYKERLEKWDWDVLKDFISINFEVERKEAISNLNKKIKDLRAKVKDLRAKVDNAKTPYEANTFIMEVEDLEVEEKAINDEVLKYL